MTFKEFIDENAGLYGMGGTLCSDIQSDKEFPVEGNAEEQFSYLRDFIVPRNQHLREHVEELISEYKNHG